MVCGSVGRASAGPADTAYVLDHSPARIDGAIQPLVEYRGRVILIVNVASKCGLTPQYAALEAIYRQRKDRGLVVLGFPANNFNGQEPGTNEQIASFCDSEYHVTFPMFSKVSVKGEDQDELYRDLCTQPEPIGGDPTWNFTKFLVDHHGNVVARFDPRTTPDDPALLAKIDELLAARSADRPGRRVWWD
ncbi:MAG: glutathione peroxidase [Phycisphaeraceae bacterium]|nr:glutathione peroxidase [Phycisphaeraceae bacterium]